MTNRSLHHHDPFRGGRLRHLPRIGEEMAEGPVTIHAHVDRYPPFVNAGAEWMLHAMLRDSVNRGHRVLVTTACVDAPTSSDGVEVFPTAYGPECAAVADVAVAHLLWTNEAIRLASAAQLPLLYLVHNDNQIRFWRLGAAKVSAYVWNSEWVAAKCGRWPEARGVPSVVVRPPLIRADYAVTDPPPAERSCVTLVNPIEAKGSRTFYALARRMPRRRFLAVEGAYGTQQRPRHPNVEWQPQTGDMRGDVYARTRVLLMPSHVESWGRAAVEALAAGVPVIASPTPGLREALGDGWPFLVEHSDVQGWEAAVEALDDPETYAATSALALARAAELEALAGTDLERWDRLVRLAASTTLGRMTPTTPLVGAAREPLPTAMPVTEAERVAWIRRGRGQGRRARAEAVWERETRRKGGPRPAIAAAVAEALGNAVKAG